MESFNKKMVGPLILFLLLIFIVLFYGSSHLGAVIQGPTVSSIDKTVFTFLGILALIGFVVLIFGKINK